MEEKTSSVSDSNKGEVPDTDVVKVEKEEEKEKHPLEIDNYQNNLRYMRNATY